MICLTVVLFCQDGPDSFFNQKIGADRTLISHEEIIRYFKYLDTVSPRIITTVEGESTLSNPLILGIISSETNLRNLPKLLEINRKLAYPGNISEEEFSSLVTEARVFILVTCALHATEIGASQMAMEWAHHLITSGDPVNERILKESVILLMPSINPDGHDMITAWYKKYLGTPYEGSRLPYLYHHYAGHDNNRDFFMLNLKETQVVNRILHKKYFPHVFLDMHQMGSTGPRMFVPPFKDPMNQNLDPILLKETDLIGTYMALKLQESKKQGIASGYGFDAYWPGGSKNTAWFKNVVGILTELASVKIASPVYIEKNELRVSSKGLPQYKQQTNFPDPWKGGWWRLRDILDYELIAVEALSDIVSQNRKTFVKNFLQMGIDNIQRGITSRPYGYLISPEQWDLPMSYVFLQKMAEHGVQIFQMSESHSCPSQTIKKNTYVIPNNQSYRNFIQVMMERQHYPEVLHMREGPVIEPYDASGWTLPLQMGVSVEELLVPVSKLKLSALASIRLPETSVNGDGDWYCLSCRSNYSITAVNRLLNKQVPVFRSVDNDPLKDGDFVIPVSAITGNDLGRLLHDLGLSIQKKFFKSPLKTLKIRNPETAIYQSYLASSDEGWTRWVLDHHEFSYRVLHNKHFKKKGDLKQFDLIIFPDMGRSQIVDGTSEWAKRYGPAFLPPEFTGGIGNEGITRLESFVREGGTLLLMDSAYELAASDFKLQISNKLDKIPRSDFFVPGAILSIEVNPADPIGWGMPADSILFFRNSPAFQTRPPSSPEIDRRVVARYRETGPHLLSGYMKGGKKLDKAAAIVRFKYHKGYIIIAGGRIQHRAQSTATFKFLFNSIYFSSTPGIW